MKRILILCVLCVNAHAGEIARDDAGKVISITTITATGKTTRDAAGSVLEQKQRIVYPDNSKTIIVRDAGNSVIRIESKDSKRR